MRKHPLREAGSADLTVAADADKTDQGALFEIEGPDERGCVWIHSIGPRDSWSQNLGPAYKVAEALSQWPGSIDYGEKGP